MKNFFAKELDLIKTPIQEGYTINKIPEIGFEHIILDNLIVENNYIKRAYILSSTDSTVRGCHAHLNQFQILVLISGSALLKLTIKHGDLTEWELKNGPVLVPKQHWIELFLDKNTKVLSLASSTYSELRTIFNKEEFLNT